MKNMIRRSQKGIDNVIPRKRRDLSDIAGTWKADKTLDAVLAHQQRIEKDLWRRA